MLSRKPYKPVILTSRPTFSTLHQRRAATNSQSALYGAMTKPPNVEEDLDTQTDPNDAGVRYKSIELFV